MLVHHGECWLRGVPALLGNDLWHSYYRKLSFFFFSPYQPLLICTPYTSSTYLVLGHRCGQVYFTLPPV